MGGLASGDVAGKRWADWVTDETTWWDANLGRDVFYRVWAMLSQYQVLSISIAF